MSDLQRRVEALYTNYNISLDDLALDNWVNLFAENCLYRIVSRENWEAELPLSTMMCDSKGMLVDRVKGIQQTMMFAPRYCRRFISSLQITEITHDSISTRSSFLCIQTLNDEPSEVAFCGAAHDRLVEIEGELRIRQRVCVLDTEMIPNSLIYPL
ncbi:MAG: aromatic-ring-hydroxylating dioxygenase subunit beta [Granulosicoccus sp.]|nr:aromatic-ring-hydroxylating dioxygenase subunit beta [Granulosicoccus sp.]